jgi:hypothetical protein
MLTVKGSLRRHTAWWQANVKNKYIVDVVKDGYKLPLLAVPTSSTINNNKSARDNAQFVTDEIARLIISGAVFSNYQKNPL